MSNEEFNRLTPKQLAQEITSDYTDMIPSMKAAIQASSEFQSLIIQEMGNIIKTMPKEIKQFLFPDANSVSDPRPPSTIPITPVPALNAGLQVIDILKALAGAINFNVLPAAHADTGTPTVNPINNFKPYIGEIPSQNVKDPRTPGQVEQDRRDKETAAFEAKRKAEELAKTKEAFQEHDIDHNKELEKIYNKEPTPTQTRRRTQSSDLEKAKIIREIADVGTLITANRSSQAREGNPSRKKSLIRAFYELQEELQALQIKLVTHLKTYV